MSDLNGAYYGPSIPPPKKVSHSHGRRGGSCGCGCLGDCLGCCGCCILSVIFNILIAIAVLLGIAALIIWLIFRPNGIKFHVTDAKLTEFTLDPATNNIRYNLDLNFTIRNPNRRIGVYYDQIEVRGLYGDQRFGSSNISPFYQGHKNTTVVGTKLGGQQLVLLDGEDRKDLDEDVNSKIYRIDTKLRLRVRFKFGLIKSWRFKPNIECELKVPLSNTNTTSGFQFQRTKCDVDF
ncbi:PREDICTED: NDR1/HIN1-Like protein 3 [Camelina sativa]|uniref:NDR1/HIN1-Like protein 3 n=1 Tax=Camelina sativa TaxID=90675 RepID=A0ABM0TAL6_CAMSA|nr:PREDICTED: NDR1/HIN1-Like protein 3 [Camelina sativa]